MTQEQYKKFVDNYYTTNNKWLTTMVNNVVLRVKSYNPNADPLELLTNSYMHVIEDNIYDKVVVAKNPTKKLKSIIINFCKMQCYWGQSKFLIEARIPEYDQFMEEVLEEDYEIDPEDFEKRQKYEDEELLQLIEVKERINNLNLPGRILYDMVYVEGLNNREISERIRLNITSTWYMRKRLENYLKGNITINDRIV